MPSPLPFIYGKITDIRNTLYKRGVLSSFDLGARTISVGNITAGGTGKTPLVILVSETLAARGERVCILTRGYGRANPKNRLVVSDGEKILSDVAHSGDEPMEVAKKLLGKAVVIADADRVAAAAWAKDQFGVTVFVLDDGFQHRRAKRDLDIVCIDATDPFGSGMMLPTGRLREPLPNLKRAGAIVITRADLAADLAGVRSRVAEFAGDTPTFTATTRMLRLLPLEEFNASGSGSPEGNFQSLAHASGFAFCALGNPEAFFGQLRRDNFEIAGTQAFPDHHSYTAPDLEQLTAKAKSLGAGFLLTTPKDAVKLSDWKPALRCFVVESDVVIDGRERFAALL